MHFSVLSVRAVFVLLTINTVLNVLCDLVLYVAELVVSSDEFYCARYSRVSVERIVVVLTYDLVSQFH